MAKNEYPTTPLPYYYPTTLLGGPAMTPEYDNVEDIIMDLWDYCMELEDEYYRTKSEDVLIKFAIAIVTVQYWEDVSLTLEGIHVYRLYF